jgi:hypothetical protein
MPRDCIEQDGAIRVSTLIGAGDGTAGDPADWTRQSASGSPDRLNRTWKVGGSRQAAEGRRRPLNRTA